METQGQRGRWVGYSSGPGGKDHLSPDVRAEIERQETLRKERQGRLLCVVHVQVYEHDAVPGVEFPAGCALDVESDSGDIAAAVAQAQEALITWR